ncbi:helix-turn-helix domain-containing protein [Sporosarcina sp. P33]|uniref:helix-turn-helix domain-containing protein n=1 Tax=Sporosarcina sp. P33 TaxID=1930764 RepID=UPI0009C0C044|nr:helix-turn-helix domain-containing protein [Sporosarcina sp. P33]ARD49321.1 hypothetical protein SporoP33_14405 [Sporosarcina sp. P33]
MGILLALLFILQIISFMVITLLFLKISKFNNLEKKQQQLMKEMDQSVLAYLSEIKEENDRLISQLEQQAHSNNGTLKDRQPISEAPEKTAATKQPQPKPHPLPVQLALRSYQKNAENKPKAKESLPNQEPKPLDDREMAKQLYAEGKSISEIARELKKGKTEIELLLKFG